MTDLDLMFLTLLSMRFCPHYSLFCVRNKLMSNDKKLKAMLFCFACIIWIIGMVFGHATGRRR